MLDLFKDYIVDVWELRKARPYDENSSASKSQSQTSSGKLEDVGHGSRLTCLQGSYGRHHYFMCVYMYSWLHPVL